MREVFLIGAGFSKHVHDGMLLTNELGAKARTTIEPLYSLPPPLNFFTQKTSGTEDAELWLTYLAEHHPWLDEATNLSNRSLFLRYAAKMSEILNQATSNAVASSAEPPSWVDALVRRWHENRSTVITMNYDTIIERIYRRVYAYSHVLDLYPGPLTQVESRTGNPFGSGKDVETMHLCKLHGSVNWYYSGHSDFSGEVIWCGNVSGWGKPNDEDLNSARNSSDLQLFLVPPTINKPALYT